LLRHGFGGRQEACAEASNGEYRLTDRGHGAFANVTVGRDWRRYSAIGARIAHALRTGKPYLMPYGSAKSCGHLDAIGSTHRLRTGSAFRRIGGGSAT